VVKTSEVENNSNNNPLVSVGIPTYNRPEGLRRTLECITNQTYTNLEIIISDNCSPNPDVERIGREFAEKDPRIQYFRQKENFGAFNNFNFVLERATGQYFMFAADDDEWELFSISTFFSEFTRNPNIVLVMSACKRVDERGNTYDFIYNFHSEVDISKASKIKLALNASTNYYWTYLLYGLFKMDYIKRTFRGSLEIFGSDLVFIIQLLLSSEFSYVTQDLYIRKVYETNTEIRYKNETLGRLYSDPLKYYKMMLNLSRFLLFSKEVSNKTKLWIPLIIANMFINQILNDCKGILICIYYKISASSHSHKLRT
jgi:glycosyltransferase involved in cell wall biosynthesis